MLLLKKIPWLSLTLLLITYSALGWLVYASESLWYVLLSAALVILSAEILAAPVSLFRNLVTSALRSDTVAFVFVFTLAFAITVLLSWIYIVVRALILIAAELLAKLDLQTNGFTPWQAFWILSGVSLVGFGLGWVTHHALYPISH